MKRRIASLVLVVVLVIGLAPLAAAQTPVTADKYVVQKGDTLYALNGIYSKDQPEFRALLMLNPELAKPKRSFVRGDGTFVVIIKPNETLVGMDRLGITAEPFPIERLRPPAPPAPAVEPKASAVSDKPSGARRNLALFIAAIVALIAAYLFFLFVPWTERGRRLRREAEEARRREALEREFRQDPVTSGMPYVPGGIPPDEPERLAEHFERQAANGYAQRTGTTVNTVRVERIGPIQRGTLAGEGMVRYLGQNPQPRRFGPRPGYQARFRFPDGTEEVLQSLAGCMNPVYGGEFLSGFTFTPEEEVVPAPTPERPVPTRPTPIPVPAAARASGEQTTLVIGGLRIVMPAGSAIRTAESGEITLAVTAACDVRVQQLRRKAPRPKVVRTAASATAGGDTTAQ